MTWLIGLVVLVDGAAVWWLVASTNPPREPRSGASPGVLAPGGASPQLLPTAQVKALPPAP